MSKILPYILIFSSILIQTACKTQDVSTQTTSDAQTAQANNQAIQDEKSHPEGSSEGKAAVEQNNSLQQTQPVQRVAQKISCGNDEISAEESQNWVCLDDVLVCHSKAGCLWQGKKIPDRVKLYNHHLYCNDEPLPDKFEGLTCFDAMSANIGSRFSENTDLICEKESCECGETTISQPMACLGEVPTNTPNFKQVYPSQKRKRGTVLKDGVMYCGDAPLNLDEYKGMNENDLFCSNGNWICIHNCRCSTKESTGRFGHCEGGLSYCGTKHNNRPRNEEVYSCRDGQWVCPEPYGCECGKNKCTQNQICQNGKCLGDGVYWRSEIAGPYDLANEGDPASEELTIIGNSKEDSGEPEMRRKIRRRCNLFYIPQEQRDRYACETSYDYIVDSSSNSLSVRNEVRGMRCVSKEGCACANDTCPYGALCQDGRCLLDRNYSLMACNNKTMIFSRDVIRRECLFNFGSTRYTNYFKPRVDQARLINEGEIDHCDINTKQWDDSYLTRFEYWDGDSWLIDNLDPSYYITPEGDCKCGNAVLPPGMTGDYICDATIGYICKSHDGCACGSETCKENETCLRPGVCAEGI